MGIELDISGDNLVEKKSRSGFVDEWNRACGDSRLGCPAWAQPSRQPSALCAMDCLAPQKKWGTAVFPCPS
jgi:hypothetical protein